MKYKFKLTFLFCLLTGSISAQELSFKKIGSMGVNFIGDATWITFTSEKPIANNIPLTLGTRNSIFYSTGANRIYLSFGAISAYHFGEHINMNHDKVDLYGGLSVGFNLAGSIKDESNFKFSVKPYFHIGGRYYFTERFGAYVQGNIDFKGNPYAGTGINPGIDINGPVGSGLEVGLTFRTNK